MTTTIIINRNIQVADGKLVIEKKYRYREQGRMYVVECLGAGIENDMACLRLAILKSDPKPHSMEVGRIIDVSINMEGIGFPGMWYLYDL